MPLPCNSVTGLCNCTANMDPDPVIVNTTTFTPSKLYECGYYVGLNSVTKSNTTIFTTFNIENPNITGWYCGKGKERIYPNETEYTIVDVYNCGFSYGEEFEKTLPKNFAARDISTSKSIIILLLLLFKFIAA